MSRRTIVVAALIAAFALSLFTFTTRASDWIGIYARIDKVVFEPNATAPERIQIWGAFTLASKQDRNSYETAKRGYLYYSLKPGKEEVCQKEWADLKAIAGTDQIIGFGGRNLPTGRLRKADEKATDPDVYPVGYGLMKMSMRGTDYPPIYELRSLPKEPK
ncbi:MAG: hypothetical protein AABN33_12270 [Acidobacteriota bacterium]